MVFSSVPVYLDPPNWQQSGEDGGDGNNHHLRPLPLPAQESGGGGLTGSVKPGSLTDRARQAKIPHPEAALKCPRCESTNTKFCYFNNYSLTQPRHFCKTCRRYWTRGGALRNVPVGGGCRRNKRSSKGRRSKSPAKTTTSEAVQVMLPSIGDMMIGRLNFPPQNLPNFLTHYGGGSGDSSGLSFRGVHEPPVGPGGRGSNSDVELGFGDQWRPQQEHQFPFFNGFGSPAAGMYSPEIRPKPLSSDQTLMGGVKMEDNSNIQQGLLNLSRNFLGISGNDQSQFWVSGGAATAGGNASGGAWTDLAGFTNSSSSTRHLL